MTEKQAEVAYLGEHSTEWGDKKYAAYNPEGKKLEDLPVIFGFNNGGHAGWLSGCLISEDGTDLGGHICSSEGYMPNDLGVLSGARPDRHEAFRAHYPSGYRMDFVEYDNIRYTPNLMAAIEIANHS